MQDDAGPWLWQPGTVDWELRPQLLAPASSIFIRKSYADAFRATVLHERLRLLRIEHLVVVGAMTDFSIRSTVQRAILKSYRVTLVADAHSTLDAWDAPAVEHIAVLNAEVGEQERRFVPLRLRQTSDV